MSYDMPELLWGVPEFTEVEEVEPVIVTIIPEGVETPDPKPAPIVEPKKASETISGTIPEEAPEEKPSRWWIWLLGALILLGGLGLVLARKKSSSNSDS